MGRGPTVLLSAGVHGDEYEGQVIIRKLIAELDVDRITGRIICLPALNYPAVINKTRISPIDKGNLNRSFPGRSDGTVTEAIAHFVSSKILPMVDVGIDLHSGGLSSNYVSSTYLCTCRDQNLFLRNIELVKVFGAPYCILADGEENSTGFDPIAHEMNIPFISAELCGGSGINQVGVKTGYNGVKNILRYLKIMPGQQSTVPDVTFLNCISDYEFLSSNISGIYEPYNDLGSSVEAGQTACKIYSIEEFDRSPIKMVFSKSGVLAVQRHQAYVDSGSYLCLVAPIIDKQIIKDGIDLSIK